VYGRVFSGPAVFPPFPQEQPPLHHHRRTHPGGTDCIHLAKAPDGTFELEPGDIARLQINTERRLILVTDVQYSDTTAQLSFSSDTTLLHFKAGLSDGLLLDFYSTTVQKLQPIIYFVVGEVLYRSDQLDTSGNLVASPMAYGVKSWDVAMVFLDLDEADQADPDDLDYTNDFDDILGTRISATLGANHAHRRLAGGEVFTRDYLWRAYPRNLMYERNR